LPREFDFGTSIAGFQVDIGCPTLAAAQCEDRASDWYQWITTPRILDNPLLFMSKDAPSTGPGFYETYESDLELAAGQGESQLGNDALRLSIEWSRIFPRPTFDANSHASLKAIASAEGLAFYHRLFASMKKRGLRPFVTVNHYSLPIWIHDGNLCNQSLEQCIAQGKAGWADPNRARIVNELAKYAAFLGEEYGGEVDQWATLNEPFSAVVVSGYLAATPMRSNPPGLSGPWMSITGAKTAATAMVEAHARIYDALKAFDTTDADGDGKKAEVGIVYAFSKIQPKTASADDTKAADDAE
jgi:beta-glucosidase/6-phospho-beta-glucosidase/beta-galactosidase